MATEHVKQTVSIIEKRPTKLKHVWHIDWNDDGIWKEIAIVSELDDGTIYGIEVDKLHPIDKSRLKRFITSIHADKYPLWQLLDQGRLNNGVNPLDFFHMNYVKVKRPKGVSVGGSLASISLADYGASSDRQIGAEFSDPAGAEAANQEPRF